MILQIIFQLSLKNTCEKSNPEDKAQFIYNRIYEEEQIELFKHELSQMEWNNIIKTLDNPNTAYERFFDIFFKTYDKYFPKVRIKIKAITIQNPWITKGITKSSEKKQKLYERFLKKRTPQNEQKYKNYKNLFETIKKKAKKIYYSNKLLKCTGDIKKTWNVMKDIIGKSKIKSTNLPRKLTINKVDVYNKPEIADAFNDFFTNIGQKLASQIPKSSKTFETYMNKMNVIIDSKPLSINELKDAFFSLKINKSSGVDDVSFNIIKKCFGVLCEPLTYLFQLSLEKVVFPDDLKIAKVTPIYKAGDNSDVSNYRPISVLPCFSKILERLMYNHLYKYLNKNNILYEKQFGFLSGYPTNDVIAQLGDKIFDSFEKEQFTLGVFIDLSKAFDTVDHSILLKKLKSYGITDKNLAWFESYLSNRKQYIEIGENSKTDLKYGTCGVPQGSILGPHLFLVYVNDLTNASRSLDPIMFRSSLQL